MNVTRICILLALTGLLSLPSFAQRHSSQGFELGVRLGDTHGGNVTIDAVMPFLGSRLHADATFWDNGIVLAGLYDWKFPIADGFIFYPGVGASLATGGEFNLAAVGEVGAEYAFDIPLTIGLDWRPAIGLINSDGLHAGGFGLNVRYRF
jgi:hypothetical protein